MPNDDKDKEKKESDGILEKATEIGTKSIDTLREKNVVWGVGRGSSVASFCLFLIGVHKVNPILYKLKINEFLR